MFELIVCILFVWLFTKALGLAFQITWGLAKAAALILFAIALPTLIGCLLVTGGALLLIPVALMAGAWGILRAAFH